MMETHEVRQKYFDYMGQLIEQGKDHPAELGILEQRKLVSLFYCVFDDIYCDHMADIMNDTRQAMLEGRTIDVYQLLMENSKIQDAVLFDYILPDWENKADEIRGEQDRQAGRGGYVSSPDQAADDAGVPARSEM